MKHKVLTFLYHEVTDEPNKTGFIRESSLPYKHGIDEFKANLETIHQSNIPVVPFDRSIKQDVNLITFDDGGISNLKAADLLDQYNYKGIFFIVTDYIGKSGFLDKQDIKALSAKGHLIGSHSKTHPNVFNAISYDELLQEWKESKKELENITDEPVDICSIPGGFDSPEVYKAAYECGYKTIFNSEPTTIVIKKYGLNIYGRVCPKTGTSLDKIKQLASHKGIFQEQLIRKAKKNIKRLISPFYNRILQSRSHEE